MRRRNEPEVYWWKNDKGRRRVNKNHRAVRGGATHVTPSPAARTAKILSFLFSLPFFFFAKGSLLVSWYESGVGFTDITPERTPEFPDSALGPTIPHLATEDAVADLGTLWASTA